MSFDEGFEALRGDALCRERVVGFAFAPSHVIAFSLIGFIAAPRAGVRT